jgi:carboxy-terminal domain RNA polymerase II polypeptide A small phosphatase
MRRLMVLDLDETLVHAIDDNVYYFPDLDIEYDKLIVRPYIADFFSNLYPHFDILIFTTGTEEYVKSCFKTYLNPFQTFIAYTFHNNHAEASVKKYDKPKHSRYIREYFPLHKIIIGIDDQIDVNMDSGYTTLYPIKPFYGSTKDVELKHLYKKILCEFQLITNKEDEAKTSA